MTALIDKYNALWGCAVLLLTTLFGQFWYLFAFYLMFNTLDWLTGWAKARKHCKESSLIGFSGILKKLGYWVIILVAFMIPLAFIDIGDKIGLELAFIEFIGWFVLASLMVNEARSILENLVEMGYKVPYVLIKGLSVTEKLIDGKGGAKQ